VVADASGLEARVMGHYAARFDGGDLARVLLEGDVHARNQASIKQLVGLDVTRTDAKRVFYGLCYGAQDAKVGAILRRTPEVGKRVRDAILAGLPGLGRLIAAVTADAGSRGWLRLPDGRRAWIRARHAALNTLVQGTGAILMKRAAVLAIPWTSRYQVAFVHDELVLDVPEEDAAVAADAVGAAIVRAGAWYGFRVPLAAHVEIGLDWSCKT
jgi:DNA polymerase I-like protein with 3'-5' exonuclease and polymerase domains